MHNLFPMEAEIPQIRGVLKIVKESGGAMDIADLADEAEEEIDDLFPILDACKLLHLAKVDDGRIKLTKKGKKLGLKNIQKIIRGSLAKVEPFKTVIFAVKVEKGATTERLVEILKENNLAFYSDKTKFMDSLRMLLLKWAVRLKLLEFESEEDLWRLA